MSWFIVMQERSQAKPESELKKLLQSWALYSSAYNKSCTNGLYACHATLNAIDQKISGIKNLVGGSALALCMEISKLLEVSRKRKIIEMVMAEKHDAYLRYVRVGLQSLHVHK